MTSQRMFPRGRQVEAVKCYHKSMFEQNKKMQTAIDEDMANAKNVFYKNCKILKK